MSDVNKIQSSADFVKNLSKTMKSLGSNIDAPSTKDGDPPVGYDGDSIFSDLTQTGEDAIKKELGKFKNKDFLDADGLVKDLESLSKLAYNDEEGLMLKGSSNGGTEAYIDTDGDGKFDRVAYFDQNGKKASEKIGLDDKDNSNAEIYFSDGKISTLQIDSDKNGIDEYEEYIVQKIVDKDGSTSKIINQVNENNNETGLLKKMRQYTDDVLNYWEIDIDDDGTIDYREGELNADRID